MNNETNTVTLEKPVDTATGNGTGATGDTPPAGNDAGTMPADTGAGDASGGVTAGADAGEGGNATPPAPEAAKPQGNAARRRGARTTAAAMPPATGAANVPAKVADKPPATGTAVVLGFESFERWPEMAAPNGLSLAYYPPVYMAVQPDGVVVDATTLPADAVTYVTVAQYEKLSNKAKATAYCLVDMADCLAVVDAMAVLDHARSKRRLAMACYARPDAGRLTPGDWGNVYGYSDDRYGCGESQLNIVIAATSPFNRRRLIDKHAGTADSARKSWRYELNGKSLALVRAHFAKLGRPLPRWFETGMAGFKPQA